MRCFRCNIKFKSTNAPSRQPAGSSRPGKTYCQECWYSLHTQHMPFLLEADVDAYLADWRAFHEYRESL